MKIKKDCKKCVHLLKNEKEYLCCYDDICKKNEYKLFETPYENYEKVTKLKCINYLNMKYSQLKQFYELTKKYKSFKDCFNQFFNGIKK